ncbi:MAG: hypothetical protein ABIJ05_04120 [Patescibacteria group bacterium]
MKNIFKSKFGTILILVATIALAGIAIFTAFRLYKLRQEAVAPTAPTSEPGAASEQCPSGQECPSSDGKILRNCTPPEADNTPKETICTSTSTKGEIIGCGGQNYCCNGTTWTTNLTSCEGASEETTQSCTALTFAISTATATATATSTATATATATSTATAAPTTAPTGTQASLPEAGTSLPSILGLGIGGILLLVSLLLAL